MAAERMMTKKIRLSLDLSPQFYERLSKLEKLTHAESKAGVVRQALQIYEYIARKTLEGYSFRAMNPDGGIENPVFFSPYTASMEDESPYSSSWETAAGIEKQRQP